MFPHQGTFKTADRICLHPSRAPAHAVLTGLTQGSVPLPAGHQEAPLQTALNTAVFELVHTFPKGVQDDEGKQK